MRPLPQYFTAPEPREEVWSVPWIQIGGEIPRLIEVPHAADAIFAPDGKLYVVRNYMARWKRARIVRFPTQGFWEVTHRGLEIYSSRGNILGAYNLPSEETSLMTADANGRVFLRDGASILVVKDPTVERYSCPPFPEEVRITVADEPPGDPGHESPN